MPPVLLNAQGAVIEESKTEVPEKVDHSTHRAAFMVLIDKEGNYVFEADINKPVIPERKATAHEIKSALYIILDDIKAQEAGMSTLALMEMRAQQAMQMQQNAKLRQQLNLS